MIAIDKYLDKLAARTPVPGGGSAAALVGAIGMSLLSMVARYTAKKASGAAQANISKILKFTVRSRSRLRKIMAEDEKAYSRLSKALAKETIKDKAKLYKKAAAVPLEACAILCQAIIKCGELSAYCKRSLVSDLTEAVLLLEAAFLSSKLNVEINLDGAGDMVYTRKTRRILSMLSASVLKITRKIR